MGLGGLGFTEFRDAWGCFKVGLRAWGFRGGRPSGLKAFGRPGKL